MTVKLYRAKLIDNFESRSLRLWEAWDHGAGVSNTVTLQTGKFVQDGDYALDWSFTVGASPSGAQSSLYYFYGKEPQDLSNYNYLFAWVYGVSSSTPQLKLILRNDGTEGSLLNFVGEGDGAWGLAKVDISGESRTLVDRLDFTITETDYGSSESVKFYLDTICLVGDSFNLINTDEDINLQQGFIVAEIPLSEGIKPSFEGGLDARRVTITGLIPTTGTTTTAIIREAQLEDFLQGKNQYFFESDLVSILTKLVSYSSGINTGDINAINYTLGLIEDFGRSYIPR